MFGNKIQTTHNRASIAEQWHRQLPTRLLLQERQEDRTELEGESRGPG